MSSMPHNSNTVKGTNISLQLFIPLIFMCSALVLLLLYGLKQYTCGRDFTTATNERYINHCIPSWFPGRSTNAPRRLRRWPNFRPEADLDSAAFELNGVQVAFPARSYGSGSRNIRHALVGARARRDRVVAWVDNVEGHITPDGGIRMVPPEEADESLPQGGSSQTDTARSSTAPSVGSNEPLLPPSEAAKREIE